ncbi:MAG: hypothetical protein CFE46_02330 [Burkholderiales bacterium PBB6]|nr:MAG: hypothetical protein CFE46_02330 [Burkholderiales bacterium PBB6]
MTEPASPASPSPRPRAQRAWRAACPNCGAPVDFASAASASAVCSFCRSSLLRDGDTLRKIGESAELFDDHTPLQLGASGRWQGVGFTLVGRLQYRYPEGTWNEWHLLFDTSGDGPPRSGWLSEDNAGHVLSFDQKPLTDPPVLAEWHAGQRVLVDGRAWTVASIQPVTLGAAVGELPRPPTLGHPHTVVDLRNERDEVGTLDDAAGPALQWAIGKPINLSALSLTGLRDDNAAAVSGRTLECPSCGASLTATLASTQAITCGQCHAVVDISAGAGADLKHYAQNNSGEAGIGPQIPLGSTGRLSLGYEGAQDWTVVGYQERCDIPSPGDDDEQTFWREYLLYNRQAGFAFLVDAEDGWSAVRPLTGAPQQRGNAATWQDQTYQQRYRYVAAVTWVQGEFYWRVKRDERARVTDFTGADGRVLSREETGSEVTWSAGRRLGAAEIARGFNLPPGSLGGDSLPTSSLGGGGLGSSGISQGVIILIVVVVVILLMSRCTSRDDCDQTRATFGEASAEYQQCRRSSGSSGGLRTGGGSFGGFSSGGGGHK